MRYSLANYTLSIASDNEVINNLFKEIKIGGEGDALSKISISTSDKLWSTTSFATGGWVHNQNLSRVGTCEISVSQLTASVAKFKTFVKYFYGKDKIVNLNGVTLTLNDSNNDAVVICRDCYPTEIPIQDFADTASEQTWKFTCGEITYA